MDRESRGDSAQGSLVERVRQGLDQRLLRVWLLIQKTLAGGDKSLLSTEKELGHS